MRIFFAIGAIFYFTAIIALPTVVPDPVPCVLDLETRFFAEPIVNQGLSLYNVRQELWPLINESLRGKSVDVPRRMKQRTAYMVPNPIEYPMQKAATAKILKEVLFEVFMEVMRENYMGGSPDAAVAFDYIFTERLPDFIRCFGPEAAKLRPEFD